RYSPVSREVASLTLFFAFFVGYSFFNFFTLPLGISSVLGTVCGIGALVMGPLFIYAMHKIYRIQARPFWNHWQVLTSFYGNTLTLGALLVGLFFAVSLALQGESFGALLSLLAWPMALGLILEGVGLYAHGRDLDQGGGEGAAAHVEQRSTYGKTYYSRNGALVVGLTLVTVLGFSALEGVVGLLVWSLTAALVISTAVIGRAMFYVLVIPTTMPGAFFWRNQGFQEHARASGLAEMPQVGVLPRTEYHELQMARAKREIGEEWVKIKQRGIKASLNLLKTNVRQHWQQTFSRI
ncbi:MAG: 4Fe-4S ferredoxin, partial [Halothiobacillaceae bacterium]